MNPIRYSEGRLGRPCDGFLVMQGTSPLSSSPPLTPPQWEKSPKLQEWRRAANSVTLTVLKKTDYSWGREQKQTFCPLGKGRKHVGPELQLEEHIPKTQRPSACLGLRLKKNAGECPDVCYLPLPAKKYRVKIATEYCLGSCPRGRGLCRIELETQC